MYEAIVIGASAGGMETIGKLLKLLDGDFKLPIVIVQHLSPSSDDYIISYFNRLGEIKVKEADEKEKLQGGVVYIAPPNYHLLIEKDKTLSLTVEPRVSYARPSIDVLFDSAAEAFRDKLIGIVLTGANSDGSNGLKKIKEFGGLTIVEDPSTAKVEAMPRFALDKVKADYVLRVEDIASKIAELSGGV